MSDGSGVVQKRPTYFPLQESHVHVVLFFVSASRMQPNRKPETNDESCRTHIRSSNPLPYRDEGPGGCRVAAKLRQLDRDVGRRARAETGCHRAPCIHRSIRADRAVAQTARPGNDHSANPDFGGKEKGMK